LDPDHLDDDRDEDYDEDILEFYVTDEDGLDGTKCDGSSPSPSVPGPVKVRPLEKINIPDDQIFGDYDEVRLPQTKTRPANCWDVEEKTKPEGFGYKPEDDEPEEDHEDDEQ